MNLQETTPKQDILGEALKCIYGDDSNLQILLNEITDLKAKIRNTLCKM